MIIIVTGSRFWSDRKTIFDRLDTCHAIEPITLLVQGGAKGADSIAWDWAFDRKVPRDTVDAEWDIHGKAAGMIRNRKMLDSYPKAKVEAFPIGKSIGTRGCIREAQKRKMNIHVTEGELWVHLGPFLDRKGL